MKLFKCRAGGLRPVCDLLLNLVVMDSCFAEFNHVGV